MLCFCNHIQEIQSITYLSTPVSVKVKQDRIFIYDQEYYAYAENVIIYNWLKFVTLKSECEMQQI